MPLTKGFLHYRVPMLFPSVLVLLLVFAVPTASSWEQEECTSSCNPSPPATYVPPPPATPGGYGAAPPPPPTYSYWPPYPSFLAPPPPDWYYNAPPPPDLIWPFFPYYSRYPLHGASGGFASNPPRLSTTVMLSILASSLLLRGTWV